jgi:hypothetical protein
MAIWEFFASACGYLGPPATYAAAISSKYFLQRILVVSSGMFFGGLIAMFDWDYLLCQSHPF